MLKKILVVDDDREIRELLRVGLEKEGYAVIAVGTGNEAIAKCREIRPDMVLLDIMLPRMDGMQVCREIRRFSSVPLIMVTARTDVIDKILGLELGADDYIVKPFVLKEVLARIKAVLRRSANRPEDPGNEKSVRYDGLDIDMSGYEMKIKGKVVYAPPKELELLFFMGKNPNRVFTRDQLLDEIWGYDYFGDSRTIDVHIKRLRKKLEGVSDKWKLKTVWGVGYKFEIIDGSEERSVTSQ
ncbi:MAG: response regulator transcription factor [Oscillospiraceae bacterium]|jgi:DNA-binding response OmpR family regulator|nr:response regulator transcription factor [Oscillospiraceae bacterium]